MSNQRPTLGLADAKKKIMDIVARRDHSVKELHQKLSLLFEVEVIEQALAWARQQNWMAAPDSLKVKLAVQLARRGQGIDKINQKLDQMGLTLVQADQEQELAKAKKLATNKWSIEDFQNLEEHDALKLKAKVIRFLSARGFTLDIVSKILINEFKAGAVSHDEEY